MTEKFNSLDTVIAKAIFEYRAKVYEFTHSDWDSLTEFRQTIYLLEAQHIRKALGCLVC